MANRTGVELLPDACRVVEVQDSGGWLGLGRKRHGGARVRAFHEIPYSPDRPGACAAELRRLLGSGARDIRVAAWGLKANYQVLLLPPADRDDLEQMARREARVTGTVPAAGAVMVGDHREAGRVEVGYVSAHAGEVQARLRPFVAVGLPVTSVVTPAVAHAQIVRQRWGQFSETATAVLSVNQRATAITVVRAGVVLFARELPWGHQTERTDRSAGFDAAAFAGQVASELRRSLVFLKQQSKVDVGHILVCGDLPDLRTLTGPLMHELNIEVETLDSLDGFDVAHLRGPADEFRLRAGALRTAGALAVETAVPVNLAPREGRTVRISQRVDRRHGVAVLVGLLIAAAGWGAVTWLSGRATAEQERIRRRIAVLEPQMARASEARREASLQAARLAALDAFATQGPRVARVLEVLSKATPPEVALTQVVFEPTPGAWTLSISGQAEGSNAAAAQGAFSQLYSALRASPLLGEVVRPPALNIKTTDPAPEPVARPADRSVADRASSLPQIVEMPRPVDAGPQFIEVARDGRLYRIPLRRYTDRYRNEELERQRAAAAAARAVETAPLEAVPGEPPARSAPSVLEFTLLFEVRK